MTSRNGTRCHLSRSCGTSTLHAVLTVALVPVLNGCGTVEATKVAESEVAAAEKTEKVGQTASNETPTIPHTGGFVGVTYQLEEQALDGVFPIPETGIEHAVDANASIVARFNVPEQVMGGGSEPSPVARLREEWETVARLLAEVKDLAGKASMLDALDIRAEPVEKLREAKAQVIEVAKAVVKLRRQFRSVLKDVRGFDDSQIKAIEEGTWNGGARNTDVFGNLTLWLKEELERLEREGERWAGDLAKVLVTVEAYHLPLVGDVRALHVEGYDSIPAGRYQPIDRNGLALTDPERKRLEVEVEYSGKAADAIREIKKNHGRLKDFFSSLREKGTQILLKLGSDIEALGDNPGAVLDAATAALEEAAAGETNTLVARKAEIEQVRRMLAPLADLRVAIRDALGALRKLPEQNFATAITSEQGLLDSFQKVIEGVGRVRTAFETTDILGGIARATIDLLRQRVRETAARALESLTQEMDTLAKDLPATATFLGETLEILQGTQDVSRIMDSLSETEDRRIERPIDELVDGRVVLPTAGATEGDRIEIRVRARKRSGGGQGDTVYERSHHFRLVLVGVHRKFSGELIFARAFNGSTEARRWQPNVAVVVNWFYYEREPQGPGKFWNWLSPGIGLHVASLDQDDESVEIGIGGNISLWEGLISAGGGYNLSASEDQEYIYIGIGLLEALSRARDGMTKEGLFKS